MASTKVPNYTDEQFAAIVAMFNEGLTVDQIAENTGRGVRSVRAKLSREGYRWEKVVKPTAKREEGPTKKELLATLRGMVSFDVDGLAPATKDTIQAIIDEVSQHAASQVAEDMAAAA